MNIHEYQAKELFDRFQVPSPRGAVASTPEELWAFARAQIEKWGKVIKAAGITAN